MSKVKVSEEAFRIRREIVERNIRCCLDITLEQIDTILHLKTIVEKEPVTKRIVRPVRERTSKEMNKCEHNYKELETETKAVCADGVPYIIVGHALFYCKTCLDIQKKNIYFDQEE